MDFLYFSPGGAFASGEMLALKCAIIVVWRGIVGLI